MFDIYTKMEDGTEPMLKRVEDALGYKLFIWQKTMITRGTERKSGKTTGHILRNILNDIDSTPMDFRTINSARQFVEDARTPERIKLYICETRKIYKKLVAAGIPVRKVIFEGDRVEDAINQKDDNTWYPESVKPEHDREVLVELEKGFVIIASWMPGFNCWMSVNGEVKGVRCWREKPRRENHG